MSFIIQIGISIAILMIALLLFKSKRHLADWLLAGWVSIFLLQLIFYQVTIYQTDLTGSTAILGFGLVLLNMPVLHFYIRVMMGKKMNPLGGTLHLAPFILFSSVMFFIHYGMNLSIIASKGFLKLSQEAPAWLQYYAIPLAISAVIYCIWNLWLLRQHQSNVSNFFSFQEKINLNWIQYLIYGYLILSITIMFLIFSSASFGLIDQEVVFSLVGIAISVLIFISGFWGFRQTIIFSNIEYTPVQTPKEPVPAKGVYKKSGLSDAQAIHYANQIKAYLVQEKVYLDEDLKLSSLSEKLQIPSAHISQVLNQQFNQNFYDFVSTHRIQEATKRLLDPQYETYSILGIGLDCGFKSKSSFNRAFKKITGMTPTEFRQKNSQ